MKVVLITGSRSLPAAQPVVDALRTAKPDLVIEGGAPGADEYARLWAEVTGAARLCWPDQHWGGPDDLTGPERNGRMVAVASALEASGWDVEVHAFPEQHSRGTWSCVRLARDAGFLVTVHNAEVVA